MIPRERADKVISENLRWNYRLERYDVDRRELTSAITEAITEAVRADRETFENAYKGAAMRLGQELNEAHRLINELTNEV